MIPAKLDTIPQDDTTVEFDIDNIVTQDDIDGLDLGELTEDELALVNILQEELNAVNSTPPSS